MAADSKRSPCSKQKGPLKGPGLFIGPLNEKEKKERKRKKNLPLNGVRVYVRVQMCVCALVWAEMANECEGKRRECRKSAAGGTSTCSIEIMTCSHIPLPRWLSASTYGPVGKQCDTGPLANQTSLIPPLWLFLSRPLSLKLHLAQNYLIKELSLRPRQPLPPPTTTHHFLPPRGGTLFCAF